MSAILEYPGGKIAVISTHTKVQMDCSAYIHGTNGTIKVIRTKESNYQLLINTNFC